MVRRKQDRVFSTAANVLAVVVPSLLGWAGMHPVVHSFVAGNLVITQGAVELPREGTLVFLTMASSFPAPLRTRSRGPVAPRARTPACPRESELLPPTAR